MTNAITIKDLSFSYEKESLALISDMSLNIKKGSVTAILGANGVGKTTLLLVLLGIYTENKGEISFFEKPRKGLNSGEIKKCIGMVSQNEAIPFNLSVEEYVLLGRAPHLGLFSIPGTRDKEEAEKALDIVGMSHMSQNGMMQLSSGEKQLVNIARALAQAPEILLLDEPCSHLDLINSRKMLHLISSIAREKKTVVFTTHDPNAALAVANQVVLMKKGRLVAAGKPCDVINQKLLSDTYDDIVEVAETSKGSFVLTV